MSIYTFSSIKFYLKDWLFFEIFGGHESFLWGHWYPYLGLLVTSPLGFKARVGSALFELSRGIRVMLHIPWDSPLVWHLLTSWWPAWQPSHLFHIPARHWWDSKLGAIMLPLTVWDQAGQMLYRLSYPGSAERLTYKSFHICDFAGPDGTMITKQGFTKKLSMFCWW